jgi:hypothetical protein
MLTLKEIVLYKHGMGLFVRRGSVDGAAAVRLTFKAREMNDVLKSLTVLDRGGGHIASISYESTVPVHVLLEDVSISLRDAEGLTALLGQIRGAEVEVRLGDGTRSGKVVGVEQRTRIGRDASEEVAHLALLGEAGIETFPLPEVKTLRILSEETLADLDFSLDALASSRRKEAKSLTIYAAGEGTREVQVSYCVEAPVWKSTYRLLLEGEGVPFLQGWAIVDNMRDEDWTDVSLVLVSGLPVSFRHDLYAPRFVTRPEVSVQSEAAAAPVEYGESMDKLAKELDDTELEMDCMLSEPEEEAAPYPAAPMRSAVAGSAADLRRSTGVVAHAEKKGELLEYVIPNPVTIRRNQSALVPILGSDVGGKKVLVYNEAARTGNPMACVEIENTTGATLEGGPLTVFEEGAYAGEAMLPTLVEGDRRFVSYAVELAVTVWNRRHRRTDDVHAVSAAGGILSALYRSYLESEYEIHNKTDGEREVVVEHPVTAGTELEEPAEPDDRTETHLRFRVRVGSKTSRTLRVVERTDAMHRYAFHSLTETDVAHFRSARYVDAEMEGKLRDLLERRARIARHEERERDLGKEKKALFDDQKRMRENIKSLGGSREEEEYRGELVAKMRRQEARIEEIGAERKRNRAALEELEEALEEEIQSIAFEREVRGDKKAP